ncbi:acyltransferase family protein [Cellulomonas marina]|uniref:Peptidoglycan/LPS O-acetylase OafA/YrhL, contains acyltransferase and SGNH-hydrolase domains n=1 Tax=Cellulomonas marina TaxID=988821 RepID=A0A1I0X2I7_9CELL|nr:acyltransferase family protein [Cellulomonas marina]GIG28896.1 acyltransferase [Cellulomonas marina]SFA95121.1 Peptidoglycan/LPS O-acetylase OafA/YrhL, contains acyltransferase and SGNH-hydrolase domains [Cellulomonas marina]
MTLALDTRAPAGERPAGAPAPPGADADPAGPADPTPHRRTRPGWRTDVQGLRALAVLVVVLYHAGVPGLEGGYVGVDVFFVISGFLITGHLLRDLDEHGRIRFARFWAARARRLLPLATLVVVTTLVVARLWGSPFRIASIAWDALLAGVNGLNYRLAAQGVDYQHVDGPESPLQHFWSLAVEEQFYLVWPLLLGLLALVPRRHRRRAAAVGLVLVVAVSLLVSVRTTATNAPLAYFSLQTRAWELGVGALLAVGAGRVARLPVAAARVLAWAGLAAVLAGALLFDATTPFPGSAALVPVLGAAAVIAAGGHGAGRLLGLRPLQGLGAASYGWYLWHWPAMVLVPTVYGRDLPWWVLLELAAVTLWLATMTYWLVERPLQRTRWPVRRWLATGGALVASSVAAAGVALVTLPSLVGPGIPVAPLRLDEAAAGGLAATLEQALDTRAVPANLTPTLAEAVTDQPASTTDGCHADWLVVDQPDCRYGDPAGYRTVVLIGDSHAQQWLPALDRSAQERGWRLVAWTKSACPVAELDAWAGPLGRAYTECTTWRDETRARVAALDPDLVVVSQSDAVVGDDVDNDTWSERTLAGLAAIGVERERVLYVLDTPYRAQSVPDCLGRHLDDARACIQTVKGSTPFGDRHGALAQALATGGVATVDPTPWLCTDVACPPVVGDVMTYRDSSHVTATYSALLAPVLGEVVDTRLEETA